MSEKQVRRGDVESVEIFAVHRYLMKHVERLKAQKARSASDQAKHHINIALATAEDIARGWYTEMYGDDRDYTSEDVPKASFAPVLSE